MFGLFEGGEEIPQWYLQERSAQGAQSYDVAKRVYELEQQVAALTKVVHDLSTRLAHQPGESHES